MTAVHAAGLGLATGLPAPVQVGLLALAWSGAVGLAGLLVLRLLPRRSVRSDLAAVVTVAVASLVAGLTGAARAMFLSDHDLAVVAQIAVVVTPIALGVAVVAGRTVVRDVSRLRLRAASLTDSEAEAATEAASPAHRDELRRPRLAELAAIDDDLVETADRLVRDRRARDALEQSRRELVAWVSHDLRTPLAAIRATAEALEDGVAADPGVYLRRMLQEVDRLGVLVDDLFELSRIQAGSLTLRPTTVDLAELAHGAVDVVASAARRREVQVELAPLQLTPVRADPGTLTRALSNLVVNAVHYSPVGGRVLVDVVARDGRVVVGVEDSCGGIAADDVARLFEPGWRGNRSRTPGSEAGGGLGLAIARGLARANGGEVEVLPHSGAGCRFELALPASH